VPSLHAEGILRFHRLRLREQTVAVMYTLLHRETAFCYLQGYDPEFAALSPGTYLMFVVMEDAIVSGMTKFDLLRGEEGYKHHWRAQRQSTHRIQLSNTASSATALFNSVVA
jgi:CelD/BcsL family acetyltransferase involved in cellulose biosynthesis